MDRNYGYKHTKGFLVFVLVFIIGCISVAYGQVITGSPNTPSGYSIDSVTGNLVQNPTMTSGTGWTTSGMTGSYTPDGYIFSYSSGTIQQDVNFGSINFGYLNTSAVFATGIMYGFKYRFQCAQSVGTSCETGTLQDTLNSTFTYTAPNGTVEQTNVHQLGLKNINDGNAAYNPVWQQLAETYTFAGAKPINTVGSARLSITGMDAGFWACNPDCYGPQVKDAYMRLSYSVDPCILNPAFNPSCSGFQNILQGAKSPAFYYSYNIAQSLPHIGGGVILHGYDYGFNWANYGACYNTFMFWCTDWRTDGGGNINFRVSDKNNTTMLQQQWYVAGNNSGGSYSNRYLFTESRNSLDMGSVQWWTDSVWNHFAWVGWTRPIWTPDPCYTNGLYSPNCSNFKETLNKVMEDIKAQQERIAANTPIAPTSSPGGSSQPETAAASTTAAVSTTASNSESGPSSTLMALSLIQNNQRREQNIAMQASQAARAEAAAQAQAAQQQAMAVAETAQAAGSRAADIAAQAAQTQAQESAQQIGTQTASSSSLNLGFHLPGQFRINLLQSPGAGSSSTTSSESIRSEDTAPQTANTAIESTLPQAYTPVVIAAPMTMTVPLSAPVPTTTQQVDTTTVVAGTVSSMVMPAAANTGLVELPSAPTMTLPMAPATSTAVAVNIPAPPQDTPPPVQNPDQSTVAEIKTESDSSLNTTNFITNRANPITAIVEGRSQTVDSGQTRTEISTVNKSVANNELAGGVSIESIAVAPAGFNVYASLVLQDAAFYAPKEIYRGQRNVDNVRALRSLAQDGRHQEMIDQQYRR